MLWLAAREDFASKPEDEKRKLKHYRNIKLRAKVAAENKVMEDAIRTQREAVWARDARDREEREAAGALLEKQKVAWKGLDSQLDEATLAHRTGTLKLLLRVGVAPAKLQDEEFALRMQGDGPSLGGYRGVTDMHPALRVLAVEQMRARVSPPR